MKRSAAAARGDLPVLENNDWECSWEDARRRALSAGLPATPTQRLEWLEEMIRVAYASGALPRRDVRSTPQDATRPSTSRGAPEDPAP